VYESVPIASRLLQLFYIFLFCHSSRIVALDFHENVVFMASSTPRLISPRSGPGMSTKVKRRWAQLVPVGLGCK
jgi:hypothetical protein